MRKNNTISIDGETISKVIKYVIGILGEKRENQGNRKNI